MNIRNLLAAGLLALPLLATAAEDPAVAVLNQRLIALQANLDTADVAAYERLQARQAVAELAKARRKNLEQARYLAERRVEIAETSARTEVAQREVERLERTRSELLIEASRRDADRARREAEILARQDAEIALSSVAGKQAARVSAAQQNAAKLAREEAELVSGQKLPNSTFGRRGEVFTLPGDAFAAGQASLSAGAQDQVKALAEYLNIGKKGRVTIEGYDSANGVGQRRAQALKDALVAAGVAASRLQVSGKKAAATRARSAEVIIAP